MSQIEQDFRVFLTKHPELDKAYGLGLVNRRAFARYLIRQGIAGQNQTEAVIAMLRRYPFQKAKEKKTDVYRGIRFTLKDKVIILDFEKSKPLMQTLERLIATTDYDKGDTLKLVVGSSSIKVFMDEKNEKKIHDILEQFPVKSRLLNISEISMQFADDARKEQGVVASITQLLTMHSIVLAEVLTCSPELLLYVAEKDVIKAYAVLRGMSSGNSF